MRFRLRHLARFGDYARVVGILSVAAILGILQLLTGERFVLVVAAVLIVAPLVNWRAFIRLQQKRVARRAAGLDTIYSLRTAYYASLFLAVASTALAALGVFVVLRELADVAPMPRPLLLLLLAYPLVLISGPAIEWLIVVDELEEENRRLERRLAELAEGGP